MSETPIPNQAGRRGALWLILIFLPAALVMAGLITVFVWQGSKDGVTPKWRKHPSATNPPASTSSPAVSPP